MGKGKKYSRFDLQGEVRACSPVLIGTTLTKCHMEEELESRSFTMCQGRLNAYRNRYEKPQSCRLGYDIITSGLKIKSRCRCRPETIVSGARGTPHMDEYD